MSVSAGNGLDLIVVLRLVGDLDVAGLLGGRFGELDDRLDDRLEVPVAEHHGAEHHVFGQLLGFRFHHHHGVVRCRRRRGRASVSLISSTIGLSTYSPSM